MRVLSGVDQGGWDFLEVDIKEGAELASLVKGVVPSLFEFRGGLDADQARESCLDECASAVDARGSGDGGGSVVE